MTDEDGSALIEFIWLALLLMVPLVYIVLTVFEVQSGSFGAAAGSRSAARAYVLAGDPGSGERAAREAARIALRDQDIDPDDARISITCDPACFTPGGTVTVRVRQQIPLPLLPPALGDQRPSVRVESAQTVPFGRFREGE